jgi:hypothetical protein
MDFKDVLDSLGLDIPQVCVETGTFKGQGIERALRSFPKVISIEMKKAHYEAARTRFQTPKVFLLDGDSPTVLKSLHLPFPVFFFLDAYWHGGTSLFGVHEDKGTALLRELKFLATRPYPDILWIENLKNIGKIAPHQRAGMENPPVMLNWEHLTLQEIQDTFKPGYRFLPREDIDTLVAFPGLLGNLTET